MKLILYIFCAILAFFLIPSSAHAQETRITVSPAIVDIASKPNTIVGRKIQITNKSTVSLPINVTAEQAIFEGKPLDDFPKDRYNVADWIDFEENTYLFEPGQSKTINFKVSVPKTASPGGHYAQLSFRGLLLEQTDRTAGLVFPEITVPVLISVSGQIEQRANIVSNIFPTRYSSRDKNNLTFEIENRGNVHNLVSPELKIIQDGKVLQSLKPQPVIILPGTSRKFTVLVDRIEYGRYTGEVSLPFGSNQDVIESSQELFLVTPPNSRLFGLAIVVWMSLYTYRHRKNIKTAVRAFLRPV